MPGISREQENRIDLINWFISINGVLTDAYQIEFRIYDISAGLPGTQIFPVTEGDYENVTSGDGHFSTGSYYAYDNTESQGWTPTVSQTLGTHRIEWRWKATSASPFQSGYEDFEVLPTSVGSSADIYITVQDVRDEGVLEADYDDALVLSHIELWQALLERICRQWFNPRILILNFDGTDSDTLHFGVPIIDIEYLRLNNSDSNLNSEYYKVYNGRSYPDDRKNPRIKLVGGDYTDIYSAPITDGGLRFRKGRQNQVIKGTFGYVEEDGLTPKAIKRALLKLVIEKLTKNIYNASGVSTNTPIPPILSGAVIEERTDGHELKYSDSIKFKNIRHSIIDDITRDSEIKGILKLYRAPVGIATPAHRSHK